MVEARRLQREQETLELREELIALWTTDLTTTIRIRGRRAPRTISLLVQEYFARHDRCVPRTLVPVLVGPVQAQVAEGQLSLNAAIRIAIEIEGEGAPHSIATTISDALEPLDRSMIESLCLNRQ